MVAPVRPRLRYARGSACPVHRLASLTAAVRTNRARSYLKAATRRDPTHNARNYSRHAEIQFSPVKRVAARARSPVSCGIFESPTRPRQRAKTGLAQFDLAFGSDQPNNRLARVQK